MQFTLRQWQQMRNLVILWGLITALCAIAGPFGTHDVMGPLARIGYWGVVVAVSIAGSILVARVDCQTVLQQAGVWLIYAACLAGGVHVLNAMLFPVAFRLGDLVWLFGIIALTVGVINGFLYLARQMMAAPAPSEGQVDPQAKFLRRLPIEKRGPLVRIEAQDHYLEVTTDKGSALILLRMGEAVEELAEVEGMQVHRSHWINTSAVTAHRKVDGRDVLEMSDGANVPIARTRRAAAKEAGLI